MLRRGSCVFIACFWGASGICLAQAGYSTATLQGSVVDPQNQMISGAKVTAVNEASGARSVAVTTSEGYQIPALAPGTYRVEVEAAGFAKTIARGVELTVGQLATYDIQLQLGSVSSTVEVVADISLVQPEQTQQANLIDTSQVENLPNITRTFTQSIYTLPGVVNAFGAAVQNPGVGTAYLNSGFSIGGSDGRNNLVTIDGGENDYGSGALRDNHVPIDSIQEFQVNRNAFEAEFGFTIGTAINMVTKSGTNRLHGSASGYFGDRATDAANYFNKLAGLGAKPFEQSAIYGATLGGPLRNSKLFFFTAPEWQKLDSSTVQDIAGEQDFQSIGSQANGYSPGGGTCPGQTTPQQQVTQLCYLTQMANSGAVSGLGSSLLASPIFGDPLQDPILNALVTPNDGTFDGILSGPSGTGARNIPGFNTPRGRYFNWVTRLDYLPGIPDSISLRVSFMHELDSVSPAPPYSGSEPQRDYTLTASWIHAPRSNLVNTARAQVVPQNTFQFNSPSPNGSEIDLGNQIQLGTPFAWPYDALFRRFQFDDSLSWVKGSHSLKFGGSWRPDYYSVNEEVWFGGEWEFDDGAFSILNIVGASNPAAAAALESFNLSEGYPAGGPASTNLTAVQSFLAGAPAVLLQANPASNSQWSDWAEDLGLYAQDSWKAAPRLTINYGMRLDYDGDPAPVPHSTRFSPRLGMAWQVGGDQKTVVRAGAGIFVAPNLFMIPFYTNLLNPAGTHITQDALVAGLPSPPFPSIFAAWALAEGNATPAEPNPPLTNAELASLGVAIGPPGPNAFGNVLYTLAPNFKPAYSIQASASVAREFAHNLSLEVGYLMYRSVHIEQILETNFVQNTAVPVDPFVGPYYMPRPGTTEGEPNAYIFQNDAFTSSGTGIYNAGTVSLTRRLGNGLEFQANYTRSRAIDDTSDFSVLTTPFRPGTPSLDRSVSDFNITNNLVANAVYTTPFHADSSAFMRRLLADLAVSPIFYARSGVPFTLLVPGLSNGTIGHTAYARPWHEGRNNGVGPRFFDWDMRFSKSIPMAEGWPRVEVIAQAQNLLNRTNFAAVNDNFPVDPSYQLPNGGTLQNGPFNIRGVAPASIAQLSQPLSFTSAYPARQVNLGLRFAF